MLSSIPFLIVPSAPITMGITSVFIFHILCISISRSWYLLLLLLLLSLLLLLLLLFIIIYYLLFIIIAIIIIIIIIIINNLFYVGKKIYIYIYIYIYRVSQKKVPTFENS